jgi:endonuclease YncB( thermonuclease family)
MTPKLIALSFAGALVLAPVAHAATARIIDGDTLELNHQRYRLFGIDAPERKQQCRRDGELWACGEAAKRALERRVAGMDVTCRERDRDKYRRVVAVCYAGGQDLSRAMVRAGWAVAYTRYSRDYVSDERAAKATKLGIWAGDFTLPETYRQESRHR